MFNPITTPVFDLYKIGPGPSSSHTIGPMKAGYDFLQRLRQLPEGTRAQGSALQVNLFGSLSATGRGHGTDKAVTAGLMGWLPETCDPAELAGLYSTGSEIYSIPLDGVKLSITADSIIFDAVTHDYPYSNTMVIRFRSAKKVLLEMEYYSVGGGFVQWKGWSHPEIPPPPYPYENMEELKAMCHNDRNRLIHVLMENEQTISGLSESEIYERLDKILHVMFAAVDRKASTVHHRARSQKKTNDRFLVFLNSYALAASEENAAGNMVVTAPTSGAAGVLPATLYLLSRHYHKSLEILREGLLAAAAVGFLVKQNASISGAEIGCMGEVGTAAAMAAALISYVNECDLRCIEVSAEIALEHHLGMTCDPVGGYVQIPCIERNAVGAVKAYNSYVLASSGISASQKISLDRVIAVMRETGHDMSKKYKETSQAGLALSITEC